MQIMELLPGAENLGSGGREVPLPLAFPLSEAPAEDSTEAKQLGNWSTHGRSGEKDKNTPLKPVGKCHLRGEAPGGAPHPPPFPRPCPGRSSVSSTMGASTPGRFDPCTAGKKAT